jgi:hypothetical protein
VLDFNEELFSTNNEQSVSVFPVPAIGDGITIKVNDTSPINIKIKLIDLNGKLMLEEAIQTRTYTVIQNNYEAGVYFLVVDYDDWKGEAHSERIKILFD